MPGVDRPFGLVIIGGGPAGIAVLLSAHRSGQLTSLLADGVAIIEQGAAIGKGTLGHYEINSDSSGRTFVDCLLGHGNNALTRLRHHPLARQLAAAGDGAVALRDAGAFLHVVGEAVATLVDDSPGQVFRRHRAQQARRTRTGWSVVVRDLDTGRERTLQARTLVLATGAAQPADRLAAATVAGRNLVEACGGRLVQSDTVLGAGGLAAMAERLAGRAEPKVAIVGGSTSAMACAVALLDRLPGVAFGPGGVALLHRRPLRVYYPDRAAALAEGYGEWTEDDVCPVSGKVFRFAGFRLDSRELLMRARGIGGRAPEPRLRLHQLGADDAAAARVLDEADLVVAALGYRPRALPLLGRDGRAIALRAHTGPQAPMVDGRCRVLDDQGAPLPDLYGIGLGAGFVPRGRLGGEASFRGQANGLWLWQHDVGALIVGSVRLPARPPRRRPRPPAAPRRSPASLPLAALETSPCLFP